MLGLLAPGERRRLILPFGEGNHFAVLGGIGLERNIAGLLARQFLHPFGVRIIVIEPGAFPTEFGSNAFVAAKFNESSPYHANAQSFEKAFERMRAPDGVRQDPADVARAIYAAVHDETPKLRYTVGADAQMIAAVRKQLDFEGFEAAMRKTLDWWD